MKANIQNLAIGFGMVCSVCAAIWTYYNHNQTQAKIDLDAIFSINEKIELVKFKQVEILKLKRNKSDEKKCTEEEEKMKTLIYELIPEINFRYIQIKKPYFTFEKNWNEDWKSLIDFLYTALASDAISKPFRESMEEIDKVWDKILAEKNIQRLKN